MLPENNNNVAPADSAYLWYAMLTPESKEKVKKFIADLKETQ